MGARQCGGARTAGGVYIVFKKGPGGAPLDRFLIDPPAIFSPAALGVPSIGVAAIEREGVTHIADRIGRAHYPNVFDFIQEADGDPVGISRRIPRTFDFGQIGPGSRMLLAHDRAHIIPREAYQADRVPFGRVFPYCPTFNPEHVRADWIAGCLGFCREDTDDADLLLDPDAHPRAAVRELATPGGRVFGSYRCARPPDGLARAWLPAFFMSFPIVAIQIVADPDGGDEDTLARVRRARADVELVDE